MKFRWTLTDGFYGLGFIVENGKFGTEVGFLFFNVIIGVLFTKEIDDAY